MHDFMQNPNIFYLGVKNITSNIFEEVFMRGCRAGIFISLCCLGVHLFHAKMEEFWKLREALAVHYCINHLYSGRSTAKLAVKSCI